MYVLAFFTDDSIPKTGLSPTIKIRDVSDGSLLINGASMTEVGDGFYRYDYTTYDSTEDYAIVCDGGISLSSSERYVYAGNESFVEDIADGVWDETLAGHTTAGTYGSELATVADIRASTSTTESAITSGGIIYGTVDVGTYTSTNVRDNSYWEIHEDAADGLTLEFIFNIPNDNKAGVVKTFGRYVGTPSSTHYMELWAYNYEALAWEQLNEEFMPGGITSDNEYTHEYFERNIDRDNNEVRIRLVHNITTYNASHEIFLDYVGITSIEVITAGDIADAVWSESTSGNAIPNTFGALVQEIAGLVHNNMLIDNPVYDSDDNLIGGRVRIYSTSSSVGTDNDVLATYTIEVVSSGAGKFVTWKQTKNS